MAHVEAPHDRPLDLGPALAADLVEVGVVPGVLDRAGEAAVAVEEARRVGDRPPAVGVELGVEREVHADVLAPVAGGGVAGPRARHHQRGARGQAVAQRVVGGDVARVGEAEVVARDDQRAWRRPGSRAARRARSSARSAYAAARPPVAAWLASGRCGGADSGAWRCGRAAVLACSPCVVLGWRVRRGGVDRDHGARPRHQAHRRPPRRRLGPCPGFRGSTTSLTSTGPTAPALLDRRDRGRAGLPRRR